MRSLPPGVLSAISHREGWIGILHVIGFNRNANPIEVMYNVIDEDTINVFHAMRCRKSFLHYIKTRGEDNG